TAAVAGRIADRHHQQSIRPALAQFRDHRRSGDVGDCRSCAIRPFLHQSWHLRPGFNALIARVQAGEVTGARPALAYPLLLLGDMITHLTPETRSVGRYDVDLARTNSAIDFSLVIPTYNSGKICRFCCSDSIGFSRITNSK